MGKLLADQTWKTFVDVDAVTCKRFDNKSISEIWEQYGEPAWRKAEVEVTKDLMKKGDQIIGLGGGTLMEPEARKAVQEAEDAIRIYLKCEPEELFRRVSNDAATAATRPPLTEHGGGIEEIRKVLAQRDPVYEAVADFVFDVTLVDVEGGLRHLIKRCL